MGAVALSGNDVIILDGLSVTDLAVGTVAELTFPNESASVKVGKNGNAIYGQNFSGEISELKIILVRGTADDARLASRFAQQKLNFAGTVLIPGQFIKKIGDGQGNITNDTYICGGGVIVKGQPAKTNTDGEAEMSQVEYVIRFSSTQRTLA